MFIYILGQNKARHNIFYSNNKLCGRPPQYAPDSCKLTFDLEIGVQSRGLPLCQFSLPWPLCSRLRPDLRDKTDRRQTGIIA